MHTSNTLKTVVLLSGLAGFMVLIGTMLGGMTGLVIGLLFGLGIVGASYWSSDKLAIKAARATEVAPGQLDWLRDDLAEIARRANMPMPPACSSRPTPSPTHSPPAATTRLLSCVSPPVCSRCSTAARSAVSSLTRWPTSATRTS